MSIKTITLVFPLLLHHLFPQGEVTFVEMGQVDLHASAHTLSPVIKKHWKFYKKNPATKKSRNERHNPKATEGLVLVLLE